MIVGMSLYLTFFQLRTSLHGVITYYEGFLVSI